jgi:hypothetical protein
MSRLRRCQRGSSMSGMTGRCFTSSDEADRRAYVDQVMQAVKPGGHVIVATFAPDGPAGCSGLPVVQYDADSLPGEFCPAFELVEHDEEAHVTPAGRVQHFIYCPCVKPH